MFSDRPSDRTLNPELALGFDLAISAVKAVKKASPRNRVPNHMYTPNPKENGEERDQSIQLREAGRFTN